MTNNLTVLMPTFNRLGATVKSLSLLMNSDGDFTVHILDNNSQDETRLFLAELQKKYSNLVLHFSNINLGCIFGTNWLLKNACTFKQPVLYIENDVMPYDKDWISKGLRILKGRSDIGAVSYRRDSLWQDKKSLPDYIERFEDLDLEFSDSMSIGCCVLFRPELLRSIGFYNESTCWGDQELYKRIKKAGYNYCILDLSSSNPGIEQEFPHCDSCIRDCANKNCWQLYEGYKMPHRCHIVSASSHWHQSRQMAAGLLGAYRWTIFNMGKEPIPQWYVEDSLKMFNHLVGQPYDPKTINVQTIKLG